MGHPAEHNASWERKRADGLVKQGVAPPRKLEGGGKPRAGLLGSRLPGSYCKDGLSKPFLLFASASPCVKW